LKAKKKMNNLTVIIAIVAAAVVLHSAILLRHYATNILPLQRNLIGGPADYLIARNNFNN
jgi:hypothetical protein